MSRYKISPAARTDLNGICRHIAADKRAAAGRFRKTFYESIRLLAAQPLIGEAREEFGTGVRIFPVGNYLIFYRPTPERIEVVRVIHGARDYESFL